MTTKSLVLHKTVAYAHGCELHVGNRIHLRNNKGTYSIVSFTNDEMTITCKVWQYRYGKKNYLVTKTVKITDFAAFEYHNRTI